jgi:glutamine amidotransferase
MCRLFGLIAPRPVKITFPLLEAAESLRRQSLLNPDGWGVGYYAGGHAVVRKQPEAADGSPGFSRVAVHARSHLFVAHVRLRTAATMAASRAAPRRWPACNARGRRPTAARAPR